MKFSKLKEPRKKPFIKKKFETFSLEIITVRLDNKIKRFEVYANGDESLFIVPNNMDILGTWKRVEKHIEKLINKHKIK